MNKIYLALMLCFVSIIGLAQESNWSEKITREVRTKEDVMSLKHIFEDVDRWTDVEFDERGLHFREGETRIATPLDMNPRIIKYIGNKEDVFFVGKLPITYNGMTVYEIDGEIHFGYEYYLSIRIIDVWGDVNPGAVIYFKDGTKIIRPNAKIEKHLLFGTDFGKKLMYTAFIQITDDELKLFSEKEIKKVKLYIYEQEFSVKEIEAFKEFAKCIATME